LSGLNGANKKSPVAGAAFLFIPQGHNLPQGHKFRLSRQAAQLSFIPQGHKFRLSRQAAQLSFILSPRAEVNLQKQTVGNSSRNPVDNRRHRFFLAV
jgi:hypothetical protein